MKCAIGSIEVIANTTRIINLERFDQPTESVIRWIVKKKKKKKKETLYSETI